MAVHRGRTDWCLRYQETSPWDFSAGGVIDNKGFNRKSVKYRSFKAINGKRVIIFLRNG
jgi:hypothetical protein